MIALKYSEWCSGSGSWYCADVTNTKNNISTKWWTPARLLNISPEDFIIKLKKEFNVTDLRYIKEKNLLIYSWKNYADCHKFVLYVNRIAREYNKRCSL